METAKQALLWKQQNRPHANCHLFTDSMSSLKAFQKFASKNNLVEDINSLLDGTISLHWVKAHIGVAGNEVADKAAKAASDRKSVDIHLGIPERSLKISIRHLLLREWQDRWKDDNAKGRFTFNIFPEVKTNRCIDNPQLSQVVTNHGLCPYYLKKFNLRECNCRCGEDVDDDILHYIFRCPLLDSQRSLIRPGQSVLQILQDKHRTKEVKSLLSFLFLHQQDIFEQDPEDIS
ncbi:hypothetical protein AVEN_34823-1 [Araneus ventricosus]|uniref:RNase H type-1 domain-containing protein n=1 Tax=Araneus ventricosus TaxID=182803 RepID=A0A4Y2KV93_ARAVE|nr:hypothetical protein AVEN_34823-1 [Araneus ventricosus]